MSLARDWIAAALSADLTQNELKAFLAIFHQTLCYGKTHDALTLKRVAQLAHVRADRLTPALRAIADKGIGKTIERIEKLKASVRAKVEHQFRVIKCQFGYRKVRYRGLAKNTAQVMTLFALSNLWMVRRRLMGTTG